MQPTSFPAVSGEAVDGTPFIAPRDFSGARTVVLVGFAVDSRQEVESWAPFLEALLRAEPGVRARLLAVIVPGARLMRGVILAAIRKALPAPELRASTIVVFAEVEAFARSLGIADRKHLSAFLVDADGQIVWRGTGAYSVAAGQALNAALGRPA